MANNYIELKDIESPQKGFELCYEQPTPWELGRPQKPFLAVADRVVGPVLDAGCGTGNTSIYLAALGREVTGIDFVESALEKARAKASERGLNVRFLRRDAMTLADWDESFASVIDSGLFHVYEGEARDLYVRGLRRVLRSGGRLFLLSFAADAHEGGISLEQLARVFSDGWQVESVESVQGEINPQFVAQHPDAFPQEGPKMWFAVIRRA